MNSAMFTSAVIMRSANYLVPAGEVRMPCSWAKLTHRTLDAANGV